MGVFAEGEGKGCGNCKEVGYEQKDRMEFWGIFRGIVVKVGILRGTGWRWTIFKGRKVEVGRG